MLYKEGLKDFLESIIDLIDDAKVKGIIKQTLEKGYQSLSKNQKYILQKGISEFIVDECPNCGNSLEYHEMSYVLDNGFCGSCQNDWDKNYID